MFLLYWTAKHETVTVDTTWDELLERAVALILNLEIKPDVVQRLSGPCVNTYTYISMYAEYNG